MCTRSSVHWGREGSERSQGRSRSQSKGRGRLLDFRGQKPFHTAQFPGVCPQLVSTGVPNLSKLQYFGHLMQRADSLEKTLMVGKIESRRSNITHPGFSLWVGRIPWRRKWVSTPVFLPGEAHGQRSVAGTFAILCLSLHLPPGS